MYRKFVWMLAALGMALSPASKAKAGTITYTCDSSVAAATCNYLNTTIAGQYSSTFSDANANIYITYGSTGLGQSEQYYNFVSYSSYVTALTNNSNKNALQTSSLASLSNMSSAYGSGQVEITDALGQALGLTGDLTGITSSGGACSYPSAGCFNGLMTISNTAPLYYDNQGGTEASDAYDFYTTVEHETDEILGTSSCISTSGNLADSCGGSTPSSADLYRYSAPGTPVLDSSLSSTPGQYFSFDGGNTNGAVGDGGTAKVYNTLPNDADYGDFADTSSSDCSINEAVQDAYGCPGQDAGLNILNDGGAEVHLLNAVGFDLVSTQSVSATPEPGTLSLLGTGLAAVGMYRRRRSVVAK